MRIPAVDRLEPDVALASGATAIYKGHGGDEIFCRHHTHFYVADFLRQCGPRRKFLSLATHSAIAEGETLWRVLAQALWNAYVPRRWSLLRTFQRDQEGQSLVHPGILAALRDDRSFDLPFARGTRTCPPGKLWQISLISGHRGYYSPFSRDTDPHPVWPLLSQPIVEVALRIRTWLQMENRRERAVARAAFANDLPREIIDRTDKGGSEPLAWRVLHKNRPFIRELLMDGALVREGIVDATKLDAVLSDSDDSAIRATVPIFALVGAEAWHSAWCNPRVRSVP
jgi:asparagine synthase (glutamine-hydrolysing)